MAGKNTKEHKGEPSGANKQEGLGLEATPLDKTDENLETLEKYTEAGKIDPSVHVRHHNRNTSKGEGDDDTGEKK